MVVNNGLQNPPCEAEGIDAENVQTFVKGEHGPIDNTHLVRIRSRTDSVTYLVNVAPIFRSSMWRFCWHRDVMRRYSGTRVVSYGKR